MYVEQYFVDNFIDRRDTAWNWALNKLEANASNSLTYSTINTMHQEDYFSEAGNSISRICHVMSTSLRQTKKKSEVIKNSDEYEKIIFNRIKVNSHILPELFSSKCYLLFYAFFLFHFQSKNQNQEQKLNWNEKKLKVKILSRWCRTFNDSLKPSNFSKWFIKCRLINLSLSRS